MGHEPETVANGTRTLRIPFKPSLAKKTACTTGHTWDNSSRSLHAPGTPLCFEEGCIDGWKDGLTIEEGCIENSAAAPCHCHETTHSCLPPGDRPGDSPPSAATPCPSADATANGFGGGAAVGRYGGECGDKRPARECTSVGGPLPAHRHRACTRHERVGGAESI